MRIISGTYRGKQILAPKNLPTRPTTDFAKEALFNLVGNYFNLAQVDVLDLFAGTGNISYEFASRGSQHITAVDMHGACVKFINQTAAALKFENLQAVRADAAQYLMRAYRKWDVIFADPPYEYTEYMQLVETVFGFGRLEEGGLLVVEHAKTTDLSAHPNFVESRKYGNVHFSLFE